MLPQIKHEKTVDKVGNYYVGTIYEHRKYPEGGEHKRAVWSGICEDCKNKSEAIKYMKGEKWR